MNSRPPSDVCLLHEISTVRSGYTFRSAVEAEEHGNVQLIQMRDLDHTNLTVRAPLLRIDLDEPSKEILLQNGDILFSGKGTNNVAIVVENLAGPTVAPSMLFIIRVSSSDVDPDYLAWFINQKPAQDYFRSHWRGTSIPTINKKTLGDLPIPLPPVDVQKSIAMTDRLLRRERELGEQIRMRRADLISSLLLQKAQETTP